MHKSQILFYLLVSFVLGVFVGSFWFVSGAGILFLILVGTIVLTVSGYHKTFGTSAKGIYHRKLGFLTGCLIVIFALGVLRFNHFNSDHSPILEFADDMAGNENLNYLVKGYVASNPESTGSMTRFTFRAKKIVVPKREVFVNDDILVTANILNINYGDRLLITGSISTPKNFENFDYISYLKKDGIRVVMSYPKEIRPESIELSFRDEARVFIYKKIFNLKNKFELAINRSISEPNASFINGILLGTRHGISDELKSEFNKTGTSHILAISGYNIAIIGWAILSVLVFFIKRKKAFWISVLIIILFTIMTGASASVVRASIMGLILLFASGYGRLYDPKNSILFAGAIMINQNPLALSLDIGFQLSFAAVLGLVYLYPFIENRLDKIPKLGGLKELVLMTLSAQAAVAPLLIYYFKNFSLVSLPANILILPFIPSAMLLGFISGTLGTVFPFLGEAVGWFAWAVTSYQLSVVDFFAQIN